MLFKKYMNIFCLFLYSIKGNNGYPGLDGLIGPKGQKGSPGLTGNVGIQVTYNILYYDNLNLNIV